MCGYISCIVWTQAWKFYAFFHRKRRKVSNNLPHYFPHIKYIDIIITNIIKFGWMVFFFVGVFFSLFLSKIRHKFETNHLKKLTIYISVYLTKSICHTYLAINFFWKIHSRGTSSSFSLGHSHCVNCLAVVSIKWWLTVFAMMTWWVGKKARKDVVYITTFNWLVGWMGYCIYFFFGTCLHALEFHRQSMGISRDQI
jgi:hypothetical protein